MASGHSIRKKACQRLLWPLLFEIANSEQPRANPFLTGADDWDMDQNGHRNRLKEIALVVNGFIRHFEQGRHAQAQAKSQGPSNSKDLESIGLRRFQREIWGINDAELLSLLPLLEICGQLGL